MNRNEFLKQAGVISTGLLFTNIQAFGFGDNYVSQRPAVGSRNFSSPAVEKAIVEFKSKVKDQELGWLFENCFPNTLDTTVFVKAKGAKPDTYVITGDIDAMWLRDSTAQMWPYLPMMKSDAGLQNLIAGMINRQTKCILKDPYANAFYDDESKQGEWKNDVTDMKPGIHERKWEIDSLCYPIRLAYHYWKETNDRTPFDGEWKKAIETTLRVFKEQQRKDGQGPYTFQRNTAWATDGVPLGGYGYPVKPVGLICSMFRPSDDATIYPFLIPANFFAVVSLKQASEMVKAISNDSSLSTSLAALAQEVEAALKAHAIIDHPTYGKVYAYEVNGFGSFNLMDDANVPSLLALPYLSAVKVDDPIYQNTRKYLLSENNPFFFKGKAGEGIGGPHVGIDMIWPLSIIIRGLTSTNEQEIKQCVQMLKRTHGGTGFMHEAFHKDDDKKYTRKWFAWANTIFGEFLWHTFKTNPSLLVA
ncbi:glycoside hydrolase family 125 protein [Pseudochryseolinea flava]|uniref:Metal-independent alpha-mannosidase n=1 Tax=Pseudochryseolinea flava TaxID=2059302 RepID=A0A364XY37_9BACT|nr:glycoside hydrolase family 125 protein [Pseudochryseolinea flava]RAV99221.1 metal-independent alpha-mannosidase [Pseudochryseolinea flava]